MKDIKVGDKVGDYGMVLVEDLGHQFATDKSTKKVRFGVFRCALCNEPFRTHFGRVVNSSTKSCKPCSRTKHSEVYKPGYTVGNNGFTLIEDLGMRKVTENSSRPYRMGIFKCPGCKEPFTTQTSFIATSRIKGCRKCAEDGRRSNHTVGQTVGDNGLIFRGETASDGIVRRGDFTCPDCKQIFTTRINYVVNGSTARCVDCGHKKNTIHGLSGTKLYKTWSDMRGRCYNKNIKCYKNYGARGITVCPEWLDTVDGFHKWATAELTAQGCTEEDLGWGDDQLSIDRRDVDGDYTPDNCRFTTASIQSRNTRRISSVNISGYRGVAQVGRTYVASIKVLGPPIRISTHKTRWTAALAYDQYIEDNKLEHTKNDYAVPLVLWCDGINSLRSITYTPEIAHLLSGLGTRLLNDSDTEYIESKLLLEGITIDTTQMRSELLKLIHGYEYTYAVVEQCLRGTTAINLHGWVCHMGIINDRK